jgi:hypothetical protein
VPTEIFVKLNTKYLTINKSSFARTAVLGILFRCPYILARKTLFPVSQFVTCSYLTYIYSYLCSLADITISPQKTKAVARCRKSLGFRKTKVIAVVSVWPNVLPPKQLSAKQACGTFSLFIFLLSSLSGSIPINELLSFSQQLRTCVRTGTLQLWTEFCVNRRLVNPFF